MENGGGLHGPPEGPCKDPMNERDHAAGRMVSFLLYARHGRHLYGESPEWGLASAYH
jgi:hypothetical protein